MKKLLKVVFVVALATFANNAFAQKFAHINREEVIQLMPELKEAQTKLEAYGKELQSQIEEIQVEFNRKLDAYQKLDPKTPDEVKEAKMAEIQSINKRAQDQDAAAQESFSKKQQDLLMPILNKANEAINKAGKAGGYVYVFESSTVHYIDEAQSTNLLPAVKKELGIN
jgi:outer membrane protein